MSERSIQDVFRQIDAIDGLTPQNRNILRLLTEEMLSMAQNIIKISDATFEVKNEEGGYKLCLCAKAKIGLDAREQLVSVSSKKENVMRKGIKGVMLDVLDSFLLSAYTTAPYSSYHCYNGGDMGYSIAWSMMSYMDNQPEQSEENEWNELEKSIIVNFADDVIIGAGHNRLEMTVRKQF